MSIRHTRREFLRAAGAVGTALLGTLGCKPADWISTIASSRQSGSTQSFRSRPDLRPPTVGVSVPASDGVAPGYVFVAAKKGAGQDGPMIMDKHGRLVWFSKDRYATDFKVQTYKGEPVLTWWQGHIEREDRLRDLLGSAEPTDGYLGGELALGSIRAGAMALTVTPCGASGFAMAWARPVRAAFEAV